MEVLPIAVAVFVISFDPVPSHPIDAIPSSIDIRPTASFAKQHLPEDFGVVPDACRTVCATDGRGGPNVPALLSSKFISKLECNGRKRGGVTNSRPMCAG